MREYTFDEIVVLITVDEATGEEARSRSYASIASVRGNETYQAMTVGLKPGVDDCAAGLAHRLPRRAAGGVWGQSISGAAGLSDGGRKSGIDGLPAPARRI